MNSKSILQSKTFWLNVIVCILGFFPLSKQWISQNPETALSVLTALNVLVRFATSGRISLFAAGERDDNSSGAGMTPCWLIIATAVGLWTAALPSCSAADQAALKGVPIKACYTDEHGNRVCYSTAEGLSAEVDRRSGK